MKKKQLCKIKQYIRNIWHYNDYLILPDSALQTKVHKQFLRRQPQLYICKIYARFTEICHILIIVMQVYMDTN